MAFGDCNTECPFAKECTCIYVIATGISRCDCSDHVIHLPPLHLKARDEVNFSVRDTDLEKVAQFVHRVTGAELLIPVSRLRENVYVSLEEVSLGEALNEIGLSLGPAAAAS
jgi:hypothetical protein